MKILLLGKDGQVGWELQRSLAPLGEVIACGRKEADFEQPQNLPQLVRRIAPDVIVNAAAYTAVDKAESEPAKAHLVNAEAVEILSREAAQLGAWIVHYSTDYVFDGRQVSRYGEDDPVNPLSVYGKTKLAGEQAIRASQAKHLIFRTSWVYAARGGNFAKTMLRLARERNELKVVADQYGAPTSAELIADITALALYRLQIHQAAQDGERFAGTYHLAASGETSWHGYAQYLLELAQNAGVMLKAEPSAVLPIPTEAYPLPAPRPANSRLDTAKLSGTFELHLPDWRYHVQRLMTQLTAQG